jgi:hypothetical protein
MVTEPPPRDILGLRRQGLDRLPNAVELAGRPAAERHQVLDGLREELYQLASVVAERTLHRAWDGRCTYPPYGLARSFFSQLRVVAVDPRPFEDGSIGSFEDLGQACLDTVVFHLERELVALRNSDQRWLVERLDQLLVLFRVDATKSGQARIRDPFSFLYGGLHFGTSMCVQLAEVMGRLLAASRLTAAQKVAVMGRSRRVLFQLAAVNIEDIPAVYHHLHGTSPTPWLSSDRFVVHLEDGSPRRVDIVDLALGPPDGSRYRTRGCPARSSPPGATGAIATLWSWCTELAEATGLVTDG